MSGGYKPWRATHQQQFIIEKAHVPTLKSISIETASGRQQHALATEVAKLKELLCKSLQVANKGADALQTVSPDISEAKYMCMQRQESKIHMKSRTRPGTAVCKWLWALALQAIHCEDPFGPPNDYRLTCMKCTRATKEQSDDSSVNSTGEE